MQKRLLILLSFAIILICLLPALVHAQGGPGGGLPDDPGTPIDGGASLLVGAAVVYGAKKLKDRKAKQK